MKSCNEPLIEGCSSAVKVNNLLPHNNASSIRKQSLCNGVCMCGCLCFCLCLHSVISLCLYTVSPLATSHNLSFTAYSSSLTQARVRAHTLYEHTNAQNTKIALSMSFSNNGKLTVLLTYSLVISISLLTYSLRKMNVLLGSDDLI